MGANSTCLFVGSFRARLLPRTLDGQDRFPTLGGLLGAHVLLQHPVSGASSKSLPGKQDPVKVSEVA